MVLSKTKITFLKDVPSDMKVDNSSGWRFRYFDSINRHEIWTFIKLIRDEKIYLLIPLFVDTRSISKPTLHLSHPFLVNNESNSALITEFVLDQWKSSGYNFKEDTNVIFSFKFKRVWISYK